MQKKKGSLPKIRKKIASFILSEEGKITKNSVVKISSVLAFSSIAAASAGAGGCGCSCSVGSGSCCNIGGGGSCGCGCGCGAGGSCGCAG